MGFREKGVGFLRVTNLFFPFGLLFKRLQYIGFFSGLPLFRETTIQVKGQVREGYHELMVSRARALSSLVLFVGGGPP